MQTIIAIFLVGAFFLCSWLSGAASAALGAEHYVDTRYEFAVFSFYIWIVIYALKRSTPFEYRICLAISSLLGLPIMYVTLRAFAIGTR